MSTLNVKRIHENAQLPKKGSLLAAGYDLTSVENRTIESFALACISTGLKVEIPLEHYGRVAPRSGLAVKYLIDVAAGVIDPDYRGELKVVLINLSKVPFNVKVGDKIAQLIIEKISNPIVIEVDDLSSTDRGVNGFGSTN